MIFLFVPWVNLLLGVSDIEVLYSTLIVSTVIFVLIPLLLSIIVRHFVIKNKGIDYLYNNIIAKFDNFTMISLLLTLVLIFSYQGSAIVPNLVYIILIAIPLIIQAFSMYFISTKLTEVFKLPKDISAPVILISTSNFLN